MDTYDSPLDWDLIIVIFWFRGVDYYVLIIVIIYGGSISEPYHY